MSVTSEVGHRRGAAILRGCQSLILAFWAGMTWTIGFVVAPLLFSWLADPAAAGDIAARLFHWQAWMALPLAVVFVGLTLQLSPARRISRSTVWLSGVAIVCVLIGYFALQPLMSEARLAMAAGIEGGRMRFGALHAVAGVLYLVQGLALAVLVVTTALRPAAR
jgi:predicted permease